jgi:hypothetical protein
MSDKNNDYLIERELMRVSLEAHFVRLVFVDATIKIGSRFCVRKDGHVLSEILPDSRSGALEALWNTVGAIVTHLTWPEDTRDPLMLSFSNRVTVEILPSGMPRGTILGGEGLKNFVDEF